MNRRARKGNCRADNGGGFPDLSGRRGRIAGSESPAAMLAQAKKPLSALEIGVDHLGHVFDRQGAWIGRSIDEKSGRRLNFEFVHRPLTDTFDAVEHLLIRQAGVESLLGEADLFRDAKQWRYWLLDRPLPLLAE